MRNIVYRVATLLLIGVICYSGYQIFSYYKEVIINNKETKEVAKQFFESVLQEPNKPTKFNFNKLKETNKDAVGWLAIDGTSINNPVVQGKDNDYYLTHNFQGEKSSVGTLFVDYQNKLDGQYQNIIIYGHNRKDGSMFHDLRYYIEDPSYYSKHEEITFYIDGKKMVGKIISAYKTSANDPYNTPSFSTEKEYTDYIKKVEERSVLQPKEKNVTGEMLLTLSTCDSQNDEERSVVHALVTEVK